MSGTLGKALIQPNESCKVYSNSSGNAASITLHGQVISTTDNSDISIKTSTTDACLLCSTVLDATDIPPNVTSHIVLNKLDSYCGFNFTEEKGTDDVSSNFCDRTDGATYCTLKCVAHSNWCFAPSGLRPMIEDDFGSSIQCDVVLQSYPAGLIAQNQKNYPSFIDGSGEVSTIVTDCCERYSTQVSQHIVDYSLSSLCCLINFDDDNACKNRYYHCGHICYTSCCGCCWHTYIGAATWVSQDLWSSSNPIFHIECLCGPASCQPFYASVLSNPTTKERNTYGGIRCSSTYNWPNENRSQFRECCQCYGCLCCSNWQKNTHDSHKFIMAGCEVAFNASMQEGGSTAIILYPKDGGACQECFNSPIATAMTRYNSNDQCSISCCAYKPALLCVSSPQIKWLWYNPYTKCNYFEIMTSGNSFATSGIYSIDPTYSPFGASCTHGQCYNNNTFECATLADYISAGLFKCVSGTPSAWSEKTSQYEVSSNPRLISPCCWAIWKQCFTFGTVLAEGGWNGCMVQYRSGDLITWSKITEGVSQITDSGSGNSVCNTILKNDGANFNKNENYYFNSANCVDDIGTLEYKVSANRLERTGIVISDGEKIYVNNGGTSPISVQVWGYDE